MARYYQAYQKAIICERVHWFDLYGRKGFSSLADWGLGYWEGAGLPQNAVLITADFDGLGGLANTLIYPSKVVEAWGFPPDVGWKPVAEVLRTPLGIEGLLRRRVSGDGYIGQFLNACKASRVERYDIELHHLDVKGLGSGCLDPSAVRARLRNVQWESGTEEIYIDVQTLDRVGIGSLRGILMTEATFKRMRRVLEVDDDLAIAEVEIL